MDGDGRMYMPIEIHGRDFSGLLDSGANRSIVGRRGWAKLSDVSFMGGAEWDRLKEEGVTLSESAVTAVRVANGERCPVLGRVDLPVRVSDDKKVVSFLVVPALPHEMILGMDFWRAFGLVVDASKGRAGVGEPQVAEVNEVVVPRDGLDEQQRAALEGLVERFRPSLAGSHHVQLLTRWSERYHEDGKVGVLPDDDCVAAPFSFLKSGHHDISVSIGRSLNHLYACGL
ncbi:DNA damage-inducible protein 1 [Frankliniella fusca]|uniref:DNA damage-inducible protein 1 n=1 Tax=Frankliniella fusca TaxID=407009 RepID=A0AAE1HXI4_9NEOP|nr:DNA damage-inducible protein 1 [Frankliniella fusca]